MSSDENSFDALQRATELTSVRQPLPKLFNPLFRDQGGVNRALIKALALLLEDHRTLLSRVQAVESVVGTLDSDLSRRFTEVLGQVDQRLGETDSRIEANLSSFRATERQVEHVIVGVRSGLSAFSGAMATLSGVEIPGLKARIAELGDQHEATLANLEDRISRRFGEIDAQRQREIAADAVERQKLHSADVALSDRIAIHESGTRESVASLAAGQTKLESVLRAEVSEISGSVASLRQSMAADRSHSAEKLKSVETTLASINTAVGTLATQVEGLSATEANLSEVRERTAALEARATEISTALQSQISRLTTSLDGRAAQLQSAFEARLEALAATLTTGLSEAQRRGTEVQNHATQRSVAAEARIDELRHLFQTLIDELNSNAVGVAGDARHARAEVEALRGELLSNSADIERLHHALRRLVLGRTAGNPDAAAFDSQMVLPVWHADGGLGPSKKEFHRFYRQFEDAFRGDRDTVTTKQSRHVEVVRKALDSISRPVDIGNLDVGCGRGEWLEMLQSAGVRARGVDVNSEFIQMCRDRGLDVIEGDILEVMASLPDASCGTITGFHIVEHLSFARLWALMEQTLRLLPENGVAVFETPNPFNLRVAAHFFFLDVTHIRPVPPLLIQFLARHLGAREAEVVEMQPFPEAGQVASLPAEVDRAIFGPQDYALIIRK